LIFIKSLGTSFGLSQFASSHLLNSFLLSVHQANFLLIVKLSA